MPREVSRVHCLHNHCLCVCEHVFVCVLVMCACACAGLMLTQREVSSRAEVS